MKKLLGVIMLIGVCMTVIAGCKCGESKEGTASTTSTSSTETTTTTASAPAK